MKKEEKKKGTRNQPIHSVSVTYVAHDLGLPDLDLKKFIGCGGHSQE